MATGRMAEPVESEEAVSKIGFLGQNPKDPRSTANLFSRLLLMLVKFIVEANRTGESSVFLLVMIVE